MKVNLYNLEGIFTKTIEDVEEIISCKDGRHLITYPVKCDYCEHIENFTYQVPKGYRIEIKNTQ